VDAFAAYDKARERMAERNVPIPPRILRAYEDAKRAAMRSRNGLGIMVITVCRDSARFIANMDAIPDHALVRLEGQRWAERS
jgi:hypothetical protein